MLCPARARVAVQGPGSGKGSLSRTRASLAAVQSGLPSLVMQRRRGRSWEAVGC